MATDTTDVPLRHGEVDGSRDFDDAHLAREHAGWVRAVVASGVALALLLVGAAGGIVITFGRVGTSAPPGERSVDVGFA